MRTNSSQTVNAGSFAQFVQRRFLFVLLAVVIGAVLAFFTFQFLLLSLFSISKDPFPLLENDVVQKMRIVSIDPLSYYAVIQSKDRSEYMMINGRKGALYKEIKLVTTSEAGGIAYVVSKEGQQFVVHNRREKGPYQVVTDVVFSSDGKRLAYAVGENCLSFEDGEGENCDSFVVENGKEQKRYDSIGRLIFSSNSQHLAYVAQEDLKNFLVLDEEEQKSYTRLQDIIFTPNSNELVYIDKKGTYKPAVFFREPPESIPVKGPTFVDDDSDEELEEEFNDDEPSENSIKEESPYTHYDTIEQFLFSPDGNHMAYVARDGGETFVVIDGIEQKRHSLQIANLLYSFDSQHIAYIASDVVDEFSFSSAVFVDGNKQQSYQDQNLSNLVFSSDNQQTAYRVRVSPSEQFVVRGEQKEAVYSNIGFIKFSPDSQFVAYKVQINCEIICEEMVVINNQRSPSFREISDPVIHTNQIWYLSRQTTEIKLINYSLDVLLPLQ